MKQASAYPLEWPTGWPRTSIKKDAKFSRYRERVTIATGTRRVTDELDRMRARGIVISTNLRLRRDGLPYSDQRAPDDAGAAVYWTDRNNQPRAMAIDRYQRVADNLAAIGNTLDAMRAIERWGGATILDRAFSGFVALPPPSTNARPWWVVFDIAAHAPTQDVVEQYKRLRSERHPDRGGSAEAFHELAVAFSEFSKSRGLSS